MSAGELKHTSQPWQSTKGLVYRLTDPISWRGVDRSQNCDEINVTMWEGFRSVEKCTEGADFIKSLVESNQDAAATIQRLEAERDAAFHAGAKAVFDNLLFRAANNWHANANINDKCDRENELIKDWAQDALEEVSPDSLMQWKSLTETGRKLDEALQELTPLRALFPHGPLHEQVAAVLDQLRTPKVTNEMKSRFIGEFSWKEDSPYYDEDGRYHEHEAERVVPWDLCKKIYKEMAGFANAALQAGAKSGESGNGR